MLAGLLDIVGASLSVFGWFIAPMLTLPLLCLWLAKSVFLSDLQYQLCTLIDDVNMAIGEGVKWLLVALVVSVAFGVVALSIFGQAWTKYDESATYFHVSVILLGSAATLLAGRHVRVDIFYSRFSAKQKALAEIIGFYALLLPFCLVILWNAQDFVALAWVSLEGSAESDGIKGIFILKTFISIFCLMMLSQGLSLAGRAALLLTQKPLPPLPRHIDAPFEPPRAEPSP